VTVREWFDLIKADLARRADFDVVDIDERTLGIRSARQGWVLRAHSGSAAGLMRSLVDGGSIAANAHLGDRVQRLEERRYSIDQLSVLNVVEAILGDLESAGVHPG
jgi:hypothetical protein